MRNAKQGLAELSRPGPLAVLRGDLGMSGIPGVIYAPEEGLGLPAVAFGHDWLQPPARYADLLRHLASWGFVTAAPSSHRGQPEPFLRRVDHARDAGHAQIAAQHGERPRPGQLGQPLLRVAHRRRSRR